VSLKNSENVTLSTEPFDITKSTRSCKLGLNLYAKDRKKSKSSGPIKVKGSVKTTKEEKKNFNLKQMRPQKNKPKKI